MDIKRKVTERRIFIRKVSDRMNIKRKGYRKDNTEKVTKRIHQGYLTQECLKQGY